MKTPQISEPATMDLEAAWKYIARGNEAAADQFIEEFEKSSHLHAQQPRMGRHRDDLQPGLRSFVVGRYIVFFRPVEDTIEIVRVLHGSRNLKSDFRGD